jgi:hypothetical protein
MEEDHISPQEGMGMMNIIRENTETAPEKSRRGRIHGAVKI